MLGFGIGHSWASAHDHQEGEIMNEELTQSELYDLAVLADDYADRCDDDHEIVERYSAIRDKLLAKAGIGWSFWTMKA